MRYAPRLYPFGLLSLSVLVACTDQREAPTAPPPADTTVAAPAPLRDAAINRTDTHFAARVLTTTEPRDGVALLASGGSLITPRSEEVYLEGGYGSDGRIRFTVYFESSAKSPRIGLMRLVGNELQTYDRRGALLRTQRSDDAMAAAGLPGGDHALASFIAGPPMCATRTPECAIATVGPRGEALTDGTMSDAGEVRVMHIRPTAGGMGHANLPDIAQRFHRVRAASPNVPEAWRLEEIRRTNRTDVGGRARETTVVTRLAYRTWSRNAEKEMERERARNRAREGMGESTHADAHADAHAHARMRAAEPQDAIASAAADPPLLGQICRQGTAEFDRFRPGLTGGLSIVYQHGFCSDASVFFRFDEHLAQSIPIERSRAFSLPSTVPLDEQVMALRHRLIGKRDDRPFLLGHSQGGLVARRFGQLSPDRVSGVMTVGTPHLGSFLAGIGPVAAEQYLDRVIRQDCFNEIICGWIEDIVTDFTSGALLFGRDAGALALQDLTPGSVFLQRLNSTYESFPRVSVEVSAGRRWALARMVGDARSSPDRLLRGARPLGDARVRQVDDVYQTAEFLHYFSATSLFSTWAYSRGISCHRAGYAAFWPTCTHPAWDYNTPWNTMLLLLFTYEATGRIMDIMNGIDQAWDELTTARADETDGLIHLASQRYPSVPGKHVPQRVAVNPQLADSHAGLMKSPAVFLSVLETLSRTQGSAP